ncbi:MAG: tetratricopeptide repeat protein, partial [Terriglobia bacterium]
MTNLGKLNGSGPLRTAHGLGLMCCLFACSLAPAQTTDSQAIRTHYQRAQEALQARNLEAGAREFREILRIDPRNAEARASLGVIAFDQGNYAKASGEFQASLKLKPTLWNAEAFWGICEERLGNRGEARTHLERAFPHLEEKRLRVQVGSELIKIFQEDGEVSKAVGALEALQQTEPENADVLYTAYRTYSDLAAQALSNLAEFAPDSARMHQILAQTLMSRDDFPGAVREYSAATKIDPQLPGIDFELGQAILANSVDNTGRAQAKKEFEAALSANPDDADSEYELGEIAWLASDRPGAKLHYSRALGLRPHFVNALLGLAKVLTATDQPKEAVGYLLDAERSDVRNERVHYQLASVYRKLGLTSDADREWKTFQDLHKSKAAIRSLYQEI